MKILLCSLIFIIGAGISTLLIEEGFRHGLPNHLSIPRNRWLITCLLSGYSCMLGIVILFFTVGLLVDLNNSDIKLIPWIIYGQTFSSMFIWLVLVGGTFLGLGWYSRKIMLIDYEHFFEWIIENLRNKRK